MIEYIDSGIIIFFLGVIVITTERMRKDISKLKKVAYKNHPEDMNE